VTKSPEHIVIIGSDRPDRIDIDPYEDVMLDGERVGMIKHCGYIALVVCVFCERTGTRLPLFFAEYEAGEDEVRTHILAHLEAEG
jgi:hypothetical protein